MEIIDRRTIGVGDVFADNPETNVVHYDDFKPTLAGFQPLNDAVLLRELKLPEESAIMTPDAFAEPCLYCEILRLPKSYADEYMPAGSIARILKGIGHTIKFSDQAEGQRYFTVNYQDIIGVWRR